MFGLLIDTMGSRVLIVSSALSLAALLALFLLRDTAGRGGHDCPSLRAFQAKRGMENETGPAGYRKLCAMGDHAAAILCVYLVGLFLVAGLSFYAGTLRPKKAVGIGPPPIVRD